MKIYIAGKITGDKGYREKFAAILHQRRKERHDQSNARPLRGN